MTYNEYMIESVRHVLDELVGRTLTEAQANEVFKIASKKYVTEGFFSFKKKDTKNDFKKFRSDILNPNIIFKDPNESVIDISGFTGIKDDISMQKFIISLIPKFFSLVNKEIDLLYKEYSDIFDSNISKSSLKQMAKSLFDNISVYKHDDTHTVDFTINSSLNHKDSNNFFGGNMMSVSFDFDPNTCKVTKIHDVDIVH